MNSQALRRPWDTAGMPVRRGDIRQVEAAAGTEAEPRTALVVGVTHSDPDYAGIMLAHRCTEMATPNDAILPPSDTGLPYELVVQTRLPGTVWQSQMTPLLGRLPHALLSDIGRLDSPRRPPPPGIRTGSRETDSPGERRRFKESERQALRDLVGDCTDALIDDGAPWQLDTGLVSPAMVAKSLSPEAAIAEVAHILRTRQIALTPEDVRRLNGSGALDTARWRQTTPDQELASQVVDSLKALIDSARHQPAEPVTSGRATPPTVPMPPRARGAGQLVLGANRRLITAPFLWEDDGRRLWEQAAASDTAEDQCFEVFMLAMTTDWKAPVPTSR